MDSKNLLHLTEQVCNRCGDSYGLHEWQKAEICPRCHEKVTTEVVRETVRLRGNENRIDGFKAAIMALGVSALGLLAGLLGGYIALL